MSHCEHFTPIKLFCHTLRCPSARLIENSAQRLRRHVPDLEGRTQEGVDLWNKRPWWTRKVTKLPIQGGRESLTNFVTKTKGQDKRLSSSTHQGPFCFSLLETNTSEWHALCVCVSMFVCLSFVCVAQHSLARLNFKFVICTALQPLWSTTVFFQTAGGAS